MGKNKEAVLPFRGSMVRIETYNPHFWPVGELVHVIGNVIGLRSRDGGRTVVNLSAIRGISAPHPNDLRF